MSLADEAEGTVNNGLVLDGLHLSLEQKSIRMYADPTIVIS